MVTQTLEDKLASMVWYLTEVRAGRICSDVRAFDTYLDDPEVCQWLDDLNKKGQIRNTRFTS